MSFCDAYLGQTRGLPEMIDGVEKMLQGPTFYTAVTNEERIAVIQWPASSGVLDTGITVAMNIRLPLESVGALRRGQLVALNVVHQWEANTIRPPRECLVRAIWREILHRCICN
jgi:hypothetical protein